MRYNSLCSYGRSTPDRSRTVLISLGLRRCSSGYASSSFRRQHQHRKGNLYWLLMAAKNGIVLPCAVRSQTPLDGRNGVNASISPRRPGWQLVHLHRRKKKTKPQLRVLCKRETLFTEFHFFPLSHDYECNDSTFSLNYRTECCWHRLHGIEELTMSQDYNNTNNFYERV